MDLGCDVRLMEATPEVIFHASHVTYVNNHEDYYDQERNKGNKSQGSKLMLHHNLLSRVFP